MAKINKTIWWIAGVVIVVVIVIAVANQKPSETGPIRIGFIAPLTGNAAAYGQPEYDVSKLAVEEINASGGINGRQIEIVYEDGKCNGTNAVSAAQKLISIDKVQAIIGGFCSGETIPIVPIAEKNKVLVLSPGASSPALTGISPYFFRPYPSDARQGEVLAGVAHNKKNWRLVAIVQEQTDYSIGLYDSFSQNFQALGGKIASQSFSSDTTDFKSILAKLKAENPDALFIDVQTPSDANRFITQLQSSGWKPPLLISDSVLGDNVTIAANARAFEGAIGAEFIVASSTKLQQLLRNYKEKYGKDLTYQGYMAIGYDAVYLLKDGISAVGYDGEKLAVWSRAINGWEGASGTISIDKNGDRLSGHVPMVVHNGEAISLQ